MDFQDGRHGGHFGFTIGTILVIFDLQVRRYLLTSFESVGLSVEEEKHKIDFQDGRYGQQNGLITFSIFFCKFQKHLFEL